MLTSTEVSLTTVLVLHTFSLGRNYFLSNNELLKTILLQIYDGKVKNLEGFLEMTAFMSLQNTLAS